ncbi:MAG: uridine kinase [Bacteroidia bacterium]
MNSREQMYLVGIVGGSASGKTSFIEQLARHFDTYQITVISQDHYYVPIEQQQRDAKGELNFDLPASIDRQRFHDDVMRLISGHEIFVKEYTFNNPERKPELICYKPAPIIIMEGLFIFHYDEIRELLDLKVFLDAEEEIKLQRRIRRDASERGYPKETVLYQWHNHVMPSYKAYLEPYKAQSDIIITNNTSFERGLEVLLHHLKAKVQWKIDSVL